MRKPGQNEGCRVLGDFVCDAIPAPNVTVPDPKRYGKSQGMVMLSELELDLSLSASKNEVLQLDLVLQAAIRDLAILIVRQSDPSKASILVQQQLIERIQELQNANGG